MRNTALLAALLAASSAFAIDDKPSLPTLDTNWPHYADIVNAVAFTADAGSNAVALSGVDWSVPAGVENTNFRWVGSNGLGGAIQQLDTTALGGVRAPVESGDDVRSNGTIIIITRVDAGGGSTILWSCGQSPLAVNGLASIAQVPDTSIALSARSGGSTRTATISDTFANGTWYPIVVTWTETSAQIFTDIGGMKSAAAPSISWAGVTVPNTKRETLAASASQGQTASVAGYVLLDVAIDSNAVAAVLADPFGWLTQQRDHSFINAVPVCGRQTTDGFSVAMTAPPSATSAFKLLYWPDSTTSTSGLLTAAVASDPDEDTRQRLVQTLTGLPEHTEYHYQVSVSTNGSAYADFGTVGTCWTGTDDNTAHVKGAVVGDIHNGSRDAGEDSTYDQRVASAVEVLEANGVELIITGGDEAGPINTTYGSLLTEADAVELVTSFQGIWSGAFSLGAYYRIIGNWEYTKCSDQAVELDTNGTGLWRQKIFVGLHKSFFINPTEAFTPADTEWALQADIDSNSAWVAAPNGPPFESTFTIRHGPVQWWVFDSETYGDVSLGDACDDAENATLGSSAISWALSSARGSNAKYKFFIFHRPPGGYDTGSTARTTYRRGSLPAVGLLDTDSEWYERFAEFQRTFDAGWGNHNHLANATLTTADPARLYITTGTPTNDLGGGWNGYQMGHEATNTDPALGPFAAPVLDGVEALFYTEDDYGVWIYDANAERCIIQFIKTVNDADDGTTNEVLFSHTVKPRTSGSNEGLRGDRR